MNTTSTEPRNPSILTPHWYVSPIPTGMEILMATILLTIGVIMEMITAE